MKMPKDFKQLLNKEGENTLLGMHLNQLFGKESSKDATIHDFDEKMEVIAQMFENGIDVFKDTYKLGSVSKAFYQWHLSKYSDFK